MCKKKTYLLFIFSILINAFSYSQSNHLSNAPIFNHISVNDGLSQGSITSIVQDQQGFMWFGTWQGLNRYDGYSFIIFKNDIRDSTSISSDDIQSLLVTRDGTLWAGTNQGILNKYNNKTMSFTSIAISTYPVIIRAIYEHSSGLILIGTSQGLFTLNPTNYEVNEIRYTSLDEPSAIDVNTILEDQDGNLFIGTKYKQGGLFYLDLLNKNNYHFTIPSDNLGDSRSLIIRKLLKDSAGNILIGTNKGLYKITENIWRTIPKKKDVGLTYSFSELTSKIGLDEYVIAIEEDSLSNLWIGTFDFSGIQYFENKSDTIFQFDIQGQEKEKYKSIAIISLYTDRSGILWIGTNGAGLFNHNAKSKKFNSLKQNSKSNIKINSKSIRAILEDSKGRLWMGGYGGLDIYDPYSKKSRFVGISGLGKPAVKKYVPVWFIFEDKIEGDDIYWIGTEGDGLYRYNYKTNNLDEQYSTNRSPEKSIGKFQKEIHSDSPLTIFRDSGGNLWLGTQEGIEKFKPLSRTFSKIPIPNNLCHITGKTINKIIEPSNSKNHLWLASGDCGLLLFNKLTGIFHDFMPNSENYLSLIGRNINTILEDSKQNLWIGTNHGISKLDLKTFNYEEPPIDSDIKFKNYNVENGLANNYIDGILEDKQGEIWISSNKGLTKLNPTNDEIKKFDTKDGLQGLEFNKSAYSITEDGKLYFGGTNGINYFYTDQIKYNQTVPIIAFTGFKVLNKPFKIIDKNHSSVCINEAESISLSHEKNIISFEFSALEYTAPSKNQYAYKLDGFNENWQFIEKKREAVYTNLDPGKYTFTVKASNNDGLWNEEGKSITLVINPPWWKTPIAQSSFFLMTIVSLVITIRIITNKKDKTNALLEKRVNEKTEEINKTNVKLASLNKEIHAQNEELIASIEEVANQKDALEGKNLKLTEIQDMLDNTNYQLKIANTKLEKKVKIRTKHLEKVNLELDRFVYSASHDLSAPLKSIKGILNLFKLDPEINHEYFHELISKTISKLEDVLQNLLDYSRNTHNVINAEKIDIKKEINELMDELKYIYPEINIPYSINSSLLKNYILCDKHRFGIIFRNILSNAVKYHDLAKEQHFININIIKNHESYIISVEDNGIGIAEKHIDSIFKMFYRGTELSSGSGLGLYIVKETLKKLKGKIDVHTKINEGSKFIISLPIPQINKIGRLLV